MLSQQSLRILCKAFLFLLFFWGVFLFRMEYLKLYYASKKGT